MRKLTFVAFFAAACTTTVAASAANGDPCNALTDEDNNIPTLYIENGDTQEPLMKRLGKALMQSGTKLRLIYRNRPTCNLRTSLFSNAQMITVMDGTNPRPVRYIPASATFDTAGAAPTCTVPAVAPGEPIVLGIGATYLSSCPQTPAQPADVGVYEGPIQAYGFITNKASSQVAITAEEGYLSFGFTEGGGEAAPWVVQNLRFKRNNTASTTLTMAAAIRLLPTQMKAAADSLTSEDLITSIVGATATPDASLGILGMDLYDQRRADLKLLAFKTFGQKYAYYPDSTVTSFDKRNVRDGHYAPWAPTPYISKITAGTTTFADPKARRVFELVMGTRTGDDVEGLLYPIQSGLVPECAMKVTRASDGADFTFSNHPAPCACYYEKNVPQGSTACTACTVGNDAPCNGGKCRLGYCEAK